MKLSVKIILFNLLMVVSLGLAILLSVKQVVSPALRELLTDHGLSLARNLSDRIADSILLGEHYRTDISISSMLRTEEDLSYIFVTGTNGKVAAHTFKDGYPPDLLTWNPVEPDTSSIQLLKTERGMIRDIAIKIFPGMAPEIHLGVKEAKVESALTRVRDGIVASSSIVIVIVAFMSALFGEYITRPLTDLARFSHKLIRREFGKTVPVTSSDEVGELTQVFNQLSHELLLYEKQKEESYLQMLRTEKMMALGRLSAGFAHEIRNPLTSIKVLFEAFGGSQSLTEEDTKVVLAAIQQMDTLLQRFLTFARVEEIDLRPVDVNEMIRQVIQITSFVHPETAIEVETDLADVPRICADQTMLEQVLFNLIYNAFEAMPEGGRLKLFSREKPGLVVITIQDSGEGIPQENQRRIFDPFFTTKAEGTGLGLPIAFSIVEHFSGTIDFITGDQGTSFTLRFPIGESQVPEKLKEGVNTPAVPLTEG